MEHCEKNERKNVKKLFTLLLVASSSLLLAQTINENDKFVLITTLYNEMNDDRCAEYIICLEKNLQHPLIKKIHVLYDAAKDNQSKSKLLTYLTSHDIEVSYINGRATYQDCFDIANKIYFGSRIAVSNGDIYFNDTLEELIGYDLENKFLALTRWEITKEGGLKKQYGWHGKPLYCSQDVWIFSSPIKQFGNADIKLGILGCDATIAKEALMSGMQVLNPCLTIQCCHQHLVNLRHYNFQESYPASGFYEVEWTYLDGTK